MNVILYADQALDDRKFTMKAYILRRLLLVPVTLLGVTFIVFCLSRLVPGGPIQQMMQKLNEGGSESSSSSKGPASPVNEDEIERLEEEFNYDKVIPVAYLYWLGALPRECDIVKKEMPTQSVGLVTPKLGGLQITRRGNQITSVKNDAGEVVEVEKSKLRLIPPSSSYSGYQIEFHGEGEEPISSKFPSLAGGKDAVDLTVQAQLVLLETGNRLLVTVDPENPTQILETKYMISTGSSPKEDGWKVVVQTPEDRLAANARRNGKEVTTVQQAYDYRVKAFKSEFDGVLQGSFGNSMKYQDSVVSMMLDRVPISLYFGILSTCIIYSVCIPLGITKAIGHRTLMDNASSILIFIGYSIPGYALGAILLVYLGARGGWFPLFGLMSADAESYSLWGKIVDLAHHTVLPLIAFIIGGFASVTMLMKNSLMDNLSADYVRTAVAKGVSFKSAVFKHAFRNSFIPIATDLGALITIFVGGSLLIERVFDIPGFGMLSFNGIEQRDQTVIMGTLTVSAFLMLIGNILSDIIVAIVDPRIKFNKK